jgi:hypothetical protein
MASGNYQSVHGEILDKLHVSDLFKCLMNITQEDQIQMTCHIIERLFGSFDYPRIHYGFRVSIGFSRM